MSQPGMSESAADRIAPPSVGMVAALVVAVVGVVCGVGAFAASRACEVYDVLPRFQSQFQSAYCQAAHFPGFPDTIGSWLFIAAAWGTPVLVALAGSIAAVWTGSRRLLWFTVLAAGALTLAAWIIAAFLASVDNYAG